MRKLSKEEVEALGLEGEASASSPTGRKLSKEEADALGLNSPVQPDYTDFNNQLNSIYDSNWVDSARAFGQGTTFGFSDEAEAFARSLSGTESYDEELKQIRKEMDAYAEANPEEAMAWEVAGAVPTMFIPGLNAVKGATLAQKALHASKIGATEGAITGWGHSDYSVFDDPNLVVQDATVGSVAGGAIGGAFPAITTGAGKVTGWVGNKLEDTERVRKDTTYQMDTPLNERFPVLKKVTDFLDYTSGGAYSASKQAARDTDAAIDAINAMTPDEFKSAQTAGQQIIDAAENFVSKNDEELSERFNSVRSQTDMTAQADLKSTRKLLDEEFAKYESNPAMGEIIVPPALKRLQKALEDGASIDALWAYKTDLGRAITTGKFGQDEVPQAKLKQLYGAISEDLDDAMAKNSTPTGYDEYMKLMKDYEDFRVAVDELKPLLAKMNRDAFTPEEVVARAVKLMRDNPSRLKKLTESLTEPLPNGMRTISPINEAGMGVLYNASLNKGAVDPQKLLERHRIGSSKISGDDDIGMISTLARQGNPIVEDYKVSPSRYLTEDPRGIYDYGRAIRLAERAEESTKRGGATDILQLATTALPAVAAGPLAPLVIAAQFGTTYLLREVLSNPASAKALQDVMEKASKVPASQLTQQELILLGAVQAVEAKNE
ncbi:hypothetical protein AB4379_12210 [Vibrio breoganii]